MAEPLVSCVMVTKDRRHLARRAVECFAAQTWSNKELVVIDDGTEDYAPMLDAYRASGQISYFRVEPDPTVRLGDLRNLSLDRAQGEFVAQWDDDEWFHPDRIKLQMRAISGGLDAAVLRNTLYHLDTPALAEHLFSNRMRKGTTPGTILHRRADVRYRSLSRAEDTDYLERIREVMRVGVVESPHSHLFIRCFHGKNTWDLNHFEGALQMTTQDKVAFFLSKYIWRDILRHRAFALSDLERDAAQRFLEQSRELGILQS